MPGSYEIWLGNSDLSQCTIRTAVFAAWSGYGAGALLHDYFLYDWHVPEAYHRFRGFRHAGFALRNASREYCLDEIEKDIICRHMFPVNPIPPRYKESILVCIADKICAVAEVCYQANEKRENA